MSKKPSIINDGIFDLLDILLAIAALTLRALL